MNNLSPLGLITCIAFSMTFSGASLPVGIQEKQTPSGAFIINKSNAVVYFKPESRKANPGMEPDAAYALAPGKAYYGPFDAIVSSATTPGKIFRLPTGSKVIINEEGKPEPGNFVARAALLLPAYGDVQPPFTNFAKLVNSKQILYKAPDITRSRF